MENLSTYYISDYCVYHYDNLPSTADMAKGTMFQDNDKYIILADMQTSGRGRLGNTWQAETGNLMFNMVSSVDMPIQNWAESSMVVSLALSDVISNILPDTQQVKIKWPNDILINGAKVAGILLETIHMQTDTPKLSVGIGLNISSSPIVDSYQTCCLQRYGTTQTPLEILPMIIKQYEQWLESWYKHGVEAIVTLWKSRAFGIGNHIRVRTPTQNIYGVFVDVSTSGEIILQTDTGRQIINAGEVVFG